MLNFKMTDYTSASLAEMDENEEEAKKFDMIKKGLAPMSGNVEMNNFTAT